MVDNSTENIVKLAMTDLITGNGYLFEKIDVTDCEAASWMSKNIQTLFYAKYRPFLVSILKDEITYTNAVKTGTMKADKNERPTVEKMKEMIEILEKQPRPIPVPEPALVSEQTPAAAPPAAAPPAAAPVSKKKPAARNMPPMEMIPEGDEDVSVSEQTPAEAPASEQTPAEAPASEQTPAPISKEEADRTLTALVFKYVEDILLRFKAFDSIFNLVSSSSSKQQKQEAYNDLNKMFKDVNKDVNEQADRLRAMYCISILRGNEGGYRQRTKHSKKHSKKSRKYKKSKKSKRH